MVKPRVRKTFGIGHTKNKKISMTLVRSINRVRKEMQITENVKKGRKAMIITFIEASDEMSKRFGK